MTCRWPLQKARAKRPRERKLDDCIVFAALTDRGNPCRPSGAGSAPVEPASAEKFAGGMMRIAFLIALTAAPSFPAVAVAQAPDPWHDDLVDHLADT